MTTITRSRPLDGTVDSVGPPPVSPPRHVAEWFISAGLVLLAFMQSPGRIVPDTKLDLALDPIDFLQRASHNWDARAAFGFVPNQHVGYLFPMGPFFALGKAATVPAWVVQRTWMATILVVAFWGMLRLLRAFDVGSHWSRILGAGTYALAPPMIALVGAVSAGQLPAAMLPWVMLPLVTGVPTRSVRRSAAYSALFVVAMGAVNATATLVVLIVPALWILVVETGRRRRALMLWWPACTILASLWWAVPLALEGKYGVRFTTYTEGAALATGRSSAFEALRGSGYWVNYYILNGPWLRAGWALVSSPIVVLGTAMIVAVALYGLTRNDVPYRRFLVLSAVIGLVVMGIGYSGPLSDIAQSLLDGPLAALRNVHKFDPLIRLPIAVGVAHAVPLFRWPKLTWLTRRVRIASVGVMVALLVGSVLPALEGHLVVDGGFTAVPASWRDLAHWLDRNSNGSRALLVPAAPFGQYQWGRPLDEPLQSLARQPWAVRDLIPLGSNGAFRLLDAVQSTLEVGQGSPGLAPYLARAGVRFLVVRNDLDLQRARALHPIYVRHTLQHSPGLRLVATFGPTVRAGYSIDRIVPSVEVDSQRPYRAIEVYEIDQPTTLVRSYPVAGTTVVSGGPESLLQLADRGALGNQAVVVAADARSAAVPPETSTVLTDQPRRVDVNFGSTARGQSYALTSEERPAGSGKAPLDRLPFPQRNHVSLVHMTGVDSVDASSYSSVLRNDPEYQPFAAIDGDPTSAWVTGSNSGAVGQWIEVNLLHSTSARSIGVELLKDFRWRPRITKLRVTTAAGTRTQTMRLTERTQQVRLPRGRTTWIRLTIAKARGDAPSRLGAGIREIHIPGVKAQRTLVLPQELPDQRDAPQMILLDRRLAGPYDPSRRDEEPSLRRQFDTASEADYSVTGTAVSRPQALGDLAKLAKLAGALPALRVAWSSTWANLPEYNGERAFDNDPRTAWLAGFDDKEPTIDVSWNEPRAIDRITIKPATEASRRPTEVRIGAPGGTIRTIRLGRDGTGHFFPTIITNVLRIRVLRSTPNDAGRHATGLVTPLTIGASEISFPALTDLQHTHPKFDTPVTAPCGTGPALTIDGHPVPTSVEGTLEDLLYVRPMKLTTCGGAVALQRGRHVVIVDNNGLFAGANLTFTNTKKPVVARATVDPRSVRVAKRHQTSGVIRVGPGAKSYLVLGESYNAGWKATLDGRSLTAVRLDGWQQAWIVPAGEGGSVDVRYAPDQVFRRALLGGAVLVGVLFVLAIFPSRRRQWRGLGSGRWDGGLPMWGAAAVAVAVGWVLGGWLGAMVPAALLVFDIRRFLPWIAGGAFAIAGVIAAALPAGLGHGTVGAISPAAQLIAIVSISAVILALALLPVAPDSPVRE